MRHRVLAIANRGEIAIRVARAARHLGWQPVALLGAPDEDSYAAREIEAVEIIGPAGSEIDPELVVAAARRAGAHALHPGYGFLSENPDLARACAAAGILFIGPSPETMALCGDKFATRAAAKRAGAPVLAASQLLSLEHVSDWGAAAEAVGFPLIAKVSSGGGGRGLRVARAPGELEGAIRSALREAGASGAGNALYLERYLEGARHVEAQVAGDGVDAVALGDRDCSVQRRHQKVVEEAPAFGIGATRAELCRHAVNVAREVGLRGLGTVEFLLGHDGELAFIEINPRLQVEHTVTEEVTGLDLVELQLGLAEGGGLPELTAPCGHALQARLYAEDPARGFAPSPGLIRVLEWPHGAGVRVDAGYEAGDNMPSFYDSMVGKLIVWGADRDTAIERLRAALTALRVGGIATNRPWLLALMKDERFQHATHDLATASTITIPEGRPRDTTALIAHLTTGRHGGAWDSAGAFRLVSPATLAIHGDEGGGWQSDIVPRDAADATPPGTVVLDVDDAYELSTPDGRWLVTLGARPRENAAASRSDGILRAPMPGTVVAVHVTPGQRVARDEVLAIMTAMKIEIALAAPFDGVVVEVGAAAGDLVGSRHALITLTPAVTEKETADGKQDN